VARYRESLDWLQELQIPSYAKIFIYNKGDSFPSPDHWSVIPLPNLGQCWGTYMTHISNFYGLFADTTLFVNGSCMKMEEKKDAFLSLFNDIFIKKYNFSQPKLHLDLVPYEIKDFQLDSWISNTVENRGGLYTTASNRPLNKWWKIHFPNLNLPDTKYVSHLSTFALSSDQLYLYPKDLYTGIQKDLQRSPLQEEAHYLERLVPFIWFRPTTMNLAEELYRKHNYNTLINLFWYFVLFIILLYFLFKKN
jgi:hypothetical protein